MSVPCSDLRALREGDPALFRDGRVWSAVRVTRVDRHIDLAVVILRRGDGSAVRISCPTESGQPAEYGRNLRLPTADELLAGVAQVGQLMVSLL